MIEHDQHALAALAVVGGNGVEDLLPVRDRHNGRFLRKRLIAVKLCRRSVQLAEQIGRPAGDILGQTLGTGALALFGHLGMERLFVHFDPGLGGDLFGQVERKTEGIVELEHLGAGKDLLFRALEILDHAVEDVEARVDRAGETFFFGADDLLDVGFVLAQFGVARLAGGDNRIDQFGQERAADAEHAAMAGRTAQQAAQHIAAPFVGRQNAIRHHEDGGTDVVGDDADRDIILLVRAVGLARDALDMVQHGGDGVDLEQVADILHHAGQTLQPHAGVDIRPGQALVMPVAVRVILAEHQVPDLHITVAVAADLAVRLAAAMFGAAVIVNFRAGTAGAGTVFPEVVFLAEADHVIGRDADFLGPDIIGFIIVKVDGDKQLFGRDLKVFGQEFPRPRG